MNSAIKTITLLATLALIGSCFWAYGLLWAPHKGFPGPSSQVRIKSGATLKQIARQLAVSKVIKSKTAFYWAARIKGGSNRFKQGRYLFEQPMNAFEVMELLQQGQEHLLQFTIPEGYRMSEIFEVLRKAGFSNAGQYEALATKPSFLKTLGLPSVPPSIEGFLYPETYRFSPSAGEGEILRHLTKTFVKNLPPQYEAQAKALGLNWYQAVTLASIIEKETGRGTERTLISSVFHNRLKKKMRLQTDPTVIYGTKNYKGNITRKHLKTYSPYNTYMIPALPPTPIASPGLAALKAAVEPAKSSYLYFVGKGDGSHKFTKSYKAHNRAVHKYQHRRRKDYRSY